MSFSKKVLTIIIAAALMGCAGCPGALGWRNGVNEGIGDAVSAAISTPITTWIDNIFK